jgi:chromosomal replication initiation ATPase DnaA
MICDEFILEHMRSDEIDNFYELFCNEYNIPTNLMKVKSRKRWVVELRALFFKAAYKEGFTLTEIADLFGMHHSTIIYHVQNEVIG